LEYLILHGPNEEKIARQAILNRQPLPDFIANAPELLTGLEFYLNAFTDLSTERPAGMGGILPIPVSKMREFGLCNSLDMSELGDFIYIMKTLDKNHVTKTNEKLKSKNG
jgi:hypothetical protein